MPNEPPTTTGAKTVTIEFDAPADFLAKNAQGAFIVSAFQVGFFGGAQLVRAIEIPRKSARASGGKVLLDVPLIPTANAKDSSVTIHVRPLTSGPLTTWSSSAGSVTLPVLERKPRPQRTGGSKAAGSGSGRRNKGVRPFSVDEVNGHSVLKDALTPLLAPNLSFEEAVGSFAKIHDLATAVILSRKLDLPLSRICVATKASPTKSLEDALKTLRPSINASQEIRGVSGEARKLVGGRRPRPQRQAQPQPTPPAPQ